MLTFTQKTAYSKQLPRFYYNLIVLADINCLNSGNPFILLDKIRMVTHTSQIPAPLYGLIYQTKICAR